MKFLHHEFNAGPDDMIRVTLDSQANVLLLDSGNFARYRSGQSFRYQGGLATQSPYNLSPPHYGTWHVVIDLGGGSGSVRASVQLISQAQSSYPW